jgi:hypothetical protein
MDRVPVLINEPYSWGQTAESGKLFSREIVPDAIPRA